MYQSDVVYSEKDKITLKNLQLGTYYIEDYTWLYPSSINFKYLCPESVIYYDEKSSETIKYKEDPVKINYPIKSFKSLSERLKYKNGKIKGNLMEQTIFKKPIFIPKNPTLSDHCIIIKYTIETLSICDDTSDKKNDYKLLKDVDKIYTSNEKSDNYIEI